MVGFKVLVHTTDPGVGANWPLAHLVHAEVARPVVVEYSPTEQSEHVEVARPVAVEYSPVAQAVQLSLAVTAEYMPALQLLHDAAPTAPVADE